MFANLNNRPLQVLYSCDLNSLEQMLDNVLRGQEWQGVVQVPFSMWRHLGHQQDPDTVIDYVDFVTSEAQRRGGTAAASSTGGESAQVAGSQPSVGFLIKQASAVPIENEGSYTSRHASYTGRRRGSSVSRGPGGPDSFSLEAGAAGLPGATGGSETRTASMSLAMQELGPSMQQRKFVSLLGQRAANAATSGLQAQVSAVMIPELSTPVHTSYSTLPTKHANLLLTTGKLVKPSR